MNDMELIQGIAKYLSRFSDEVKLLNTNRDFSINIYAERALIEILNELFDSSLINLNASSTRTYPSIDLLDTNKRLGIQVTSSNDINKIKNCIAKFVNNKIFETVDNLYVFIITEKQKSYSQKSIDKHLNDLISYSNSNSAPIAFDCQKQIIDRFDLQSKFYSYLPDKLNKIHGILKAQFEKIDQQADLSNYYKELKNQIHEIVLNDEKGMTLNDIYVEPFFDTYKKSQSINFQNDYNFYNEQEITIHKYCNSEVCNPSLQIKYSNFTLILGYPGQGKTSFCKKLLNDYLKEEKQSEKKIFYLKLKDTRAGKKLIDSPLAVLHEEISLLAGTDINKHEFRKSLLILDGLDELYMKEELKLDDIEKLCKELIMDTEKFKHLTIIVTSRYGYVDLEKLKREKINILRLRLLSIELQNVWLEKYHRFHPECWLTHEKLKEYSSKANKHFIKELVEQPLLLHMIASLQSEVDADITRSKVYDQLFTELIERKYSSEGQIQILKNITQGDLRELIQEIAFEIYDTGNGFISKRRLLQLPSIQSYLKKFANKNFTDNLKGVMISFYFSESEKVVDKESNERDVAVEFLHKSLMEYMVAEKILRTIKDDFLNKDLKERFIVDESEKAIAVIDKMFGKRFLKGEIQDYLSDLIHNISESEKHDLWTRLKYFFEDFIKADFIYEFNIGYKRSPLLITLSNFIGYWLFIRNLAETKNSLQIDLVKQRVAIYISILENNFPRERFSDISYQNFENTSLVSIWGFGFNEMKNLSFENADLMATQFIDVELIDTNFSGAELYSVNYYDCIIKNCKFINSRFGDNTFGNVTFVNVDFSGAGIYHWKLDNVDFKKMKEKYFYHCNFQINDLLELLKVGLKINLDMLDKVYDSKMKELKPEEVKKLIIEGLSRHS